MLIESSPGGYQQSSTLIVAVLLHVPRMSGGRKLLIFCIQVRKGKGGGVATTDDEIMLQFTSCHLASA